MRAERRRLPAPAAFLVACAGLLASCIGTAAAEELSFYFDLDTGGHRALVRDVAFSPDGTVIVTASDDKTVRIWDAATAETVRTLRGQIGPGNEGKVFAVAFSPDGATVATGGYFGPEPGDAPPYGDVRLFDLRTGRIAAILKGLDHAVYDLAFSPDGTLLAAAGQDGIVALWQHGNADGWRPLEGLDADSDGIRKIAFAAGGTRLVATTSDNGIRLWDTGSWAELPLPGPAEDLRDVAVPALAVSRDGRRFATGTADGRVTVWNAADGALVEQKDDLPFLVGSLVFAGAQSEWLAASCGYGCADANRTVIWRSGEPAPEREFRGHDGSVHAAAASPDGQRIASAGGRNHALLLWSAADGAIAATMQGMGRAVTAVGIDPRRMAIAWGHDDACPERVACPELAGRLHDMLLLPTPSRYFENPAAVSDESGFLRARLAEDGWSLEPSGDSGDGPANAGLAILRDGKRLHSIEKDDTDGASHTAFTLARQALETITGAGDGTLLAYRNEDGGLAGDYAGGHTGAVRAIAALDRPGLLVTGSSDQTVRLWNLQTRELIVSLYADAHEWIAWTPQGYYYASDDGDQRFGWHVNQGLDREARFVRAGQLKRFLYSPELVRRAVILRSATAAVRELRPGVEDELRQRLRYKPPEFDIRVAEDQSGVAEGHVAIEVIGAAAAEIDADGFSILSNDRNVGDLVDRSGMRAAGRTVIQVPVEPGENTVRLTGTNAQGYLTERAVKVLAAPRDTARRRGKLFVAVIGVEHYPNLPAECGGRSCDLRYPVDDAAGFLETVAQRSAPLFGELEVMAFVNRKALDDRPEQARVFSGRVGGVLEPDAATIVDELTWFLEQPGPDDTTLLFVAGHGINIGEDYFFIPTDGEKRGERWRNSTLVQWSIIQEALGRAKGMRIMLLDTCHAANAFNPRLEKDVADARIVVFSATAANSTAAELPELGHGVFTYALLQGLRGEARTSDRGVTLLGLADFVGRKVSELTRERQRPFYYVGGTDNVILARP